MIVTNTWHGNSLQCHRISSIFNDAIAVIFYYFLISCEVPSVLWHCYLGIRKSIQPVKNWVMSCWHGYLDWSKVQMICISSSWCHCHPVISCF